MENIKKVKKHTSIYLDPKIVEAIGNLCEKKDRSFTKQIERILKDWLTDHGYLKK